MHEFGIVEGIVSGVLPQLRASGRHVSRVHFRRGSAFRKMRSVKHTGRPRKVRRSKARRWKLTRSTSITSVPVATNGSSPATISRHMFICPRYRHVHEVDEAHDLELVEIIAATG